MGKLTVVPTFAGALQVERAEGGFVSFRVHGIVRAGLKFKKSM